MVEWWGLCACKHLGTIHSPYVICALAGFCYSPFLLAQWLWRLRWTWRGGPGTLSVTRHWPGRLSKLLVWEQEKFCLALQAPSHGVSAVTPPWLGCKTPLGLVVLVKALLPPDLWVAEVAAQHRNCLMEAFMPYLIRSVGDSWLNHKPGEIKM